MADDKITHARSTGGARLVGATLSLELSKRGPGAIVVAAAAAATSTAIYAASSMLLLLLLLSGFVTLVHFHLAGAGIEQLLEVACTWVVLAEASSSLGEVFGVVFDVALALHAGELVGEGDLELLCGKVLLGGELGSLSFEESLCLDPLAPHMVSHLEVGVPSSISPHLLIEPAVALAVAMKTADATLVLLQAREGIGNQGHLVLTKQTNIAELLELHCLAVDHLVDVEDDRRCFGAKHL